MNTKKFYSMRLVELETGLAIVTYEYFSIHETECYNFCVLDAFMFNKVQPIKLEKHETMLQLAKRFNVKVYKVQKGCSRIAFETKELAFRNLIYRKQLRLGHLKRDLKLTQLFLDKVCNKKFDDFDNLGYCSVIPDTQSVVSRYFRFD